jgi:pimeloyl-ACP methyl ester carboxylesterase
MSFMQGSRLSWACVALGLTTALPAAAEVKMTSFSLGDGAHGVLYEPLQPGAKTHVALVNIHSFSSYVNHSACANMAERGYRILCADTRYTNAQNDYKGFEDHAPAIKAAVNKVKGLAGVTKTVLIGHSMGAPMMAFYQNVAQNGAAKACQGPEKIMPCDASKLQDLPAADGLILLDPHFGEAAATLTYVDPAVVDEANPSKRDPQLDMFNEANGYSSKGAKYSADFRKRYMAAQAAREAKLTEAALKKWEQIKADKGASLYKDDMPFVVMGARARLFQPELSLMNHSKKTYMLLKADGTRPTEVLTSVRPPSGGASEALSFNGGALPVTVRAWLGAHAIRTLPGYDFTADSLEGIDWNSTATSTSANAKGVTVPLLVMVMTGHYFIQSGELVMDMSGSADKTMVGDEGAVHGITPCTVCGSRPDQYGDTVKRAYDYLDEWLAKRF